MSRHSRIGLTVILVIACAVEAPAVRAGYVTPDSIASPILSSLNNSFVSSGGLVTNQYEGLGLLFPVQTLGEPAVAYSTAVIQVVPNHDIFVGAYQANTPNGAANQVSFQAPAGVTADFVSPGTTTPDMADVVTVSLFTNGPILAELEAFDKNGQLLKTITTQIPGGLDAPTPIELDVANIQSVYATAYQPVIDPPPPGYASIAGWPSFIWGVSSIEWHEAPEPAGFVLGGLGMLILMAYAWRRRPTLVHKMPA